MTKQYVINERIRFPEVRVVDATGNQLGVMSSEQAIQLAKENGVDLVLIAPTSRPPVCKVIDYGKLKYEIMKKEKEAKKGQKGAGVLKELKLTPKVGEHDYQVTLRKAIAFLTKKNKVKITMKFRGREVTHPEFGQRILERLISEVAEVGVPEAKPRLEYKNYLLMLVPKQ